MLICRRYNEALAAIQWRAQLLEPEVRVCLLLNQFTQSLNVMYAFSVCKVPYVDPGSIKGNQYCSLRVQVILRHMQNRQVFSMQREHAILVSVAKHITGDPLRGGPYWKGRLYFKEVTSIMIPVLVHLVMHLVI
ncbi:hypothetical protein BGZ79_006917 [Entomortierella chlamydospora]|nr:hypothetical protein BGZ79_006917 [Entomortierella chlamydospora]